MPMDENDVVVTGYMKSGECTSKPIREAWGGDEVKIMCVCGWPCLAVCVFA